MNVPPGEEVAHTRVGEVVCGKEKEGGFEADGERSQGVEGGRGGERDDALVCVAGFF